MTEVNEQQAAAEEQQQATATEELAQLREENARLLEQVDVIERRHRIDQLLVEADAIDVEAARVLTEHVIAQMDEGDVSEVVDDLRRHKPWLFRRDDGAAGSMSPRVPMTDAAADAAEAAIQSGNRRDLLRYLRMRRKARG